MGIQTASQSLDNEGRGSPFGFKNRIINGEMKINQRANTSLTLGYNQSQQAEFLVDRWRCWIAINNNTLSGTFQQVTDAPDGFKYSLKMTPVGTGTPNSNFYAFAWQAIEAQNMRDWKWGTTNPSTITLSFWVKSALTGNFSCIILNNGQNGMSPRSYITRYTINQANTWEYKTVTITGDTNSTWLNYSSDNGVGVYIGFNLGGSATNSPTNNTWLSDYTYSQSGDAALFSSTSNTWQVTGVQLEVGKQATNFDNRSYTSELQLCQRYFWRVYGQLLDIAMNNQTSPYSSMTFSTITNPTTMRASGTFAHNMTNAKNAGANAPGADQWSWYIQNQGYGTTSSGDIANLNGVGYPIYTKIGAYTLSPSAASTAIRMGSNIYIENSAEI